MLRVARRVSDGTPSDVLSLPYDERKKSRLRVTSERGQEVAITLERGSALREGDLLAADGGEVLLVRAVVSHTLAGVDPRERQLGAIQEAESYLQHVATRLRERGLACETVVR